MRADDPEKTPKTIVDVGCGIGGSSRYLAKKYGAQCTGITLSPVQAERGNALAAAQGLSDQVPTAAAPPLTSLANCYNGRLTSPSLPPRLTEQVTLQVADALEQPFPDGQFDLVWSMESGEHMPDKRKVTCSIRPFF